MKTFKEFLEESWRSLKAPSQARELSREFEPNYQINKADPKLSRAGEVTAQVADDKKTRFMQPAIRKAMQNIAKRPDLIKKQLSKPRETYGKDTIRQRKVANTTGDQDWDSAKTQLTPERVARAEKSRTKVQTSPTIMRVRDPMSGRDVEHNIGGNTRLSSMTKRRTAQVHVIKGIINRDKPKSWNKLEE
jgi:hypothetical protein